PRPVHPRARPVVEYKVGRQAAPARPQHAADLVQVAGHLLGQQVREDRRETYEVEGRVGVGERVVRGATPARGVVAAVVQVRVVGAEVRVGGGECVFVVAYVGGGRGEVEV